MDRDELKKNELIASIYDTVTCYNVHPDSDKTSLKLKIVGIIKDTADLSKYKDKTLEEADVSAAMKKILKGLEDLGIELRS